MNNRTPLYFRCGYMVAEDFTSKTYVIALASGKISSLIYVSDSFIKNVHMSNFEKSTITLHTFEKSHKFIENNVNILKTSYSYRLNILEAIEMEKKTYTTLINFLSFTTTKPLSTIYRTNFYLRKAKYKHSEQCSFLLKCSGFSQTTSTLFLFGF